MKLCVLEHSLTVILILLPVVFSWLDDVSSFSEMVNDPLQCGGDIRMDSTYSIGSPGFPDYYPSSLDCRWTVQTTSGWKINVTSNYFSVEEQNECLWDYLEIKELDAEGNVTGSRFCGYQPIVYDSVSDVIYLHFHTDLSGERAGFKLILEATPSENIQRSCNQSLIGPSGYFTSPNYPMKYPPNASCSYFIQVSGEARIEVSFKHFQVETWPCDFDKLTIYDGPDVDAPLMEVLCGREEPEPITSSSNSMFLLFSSDSSQQTTGFNASYHVVMCNRTKTNTSTTTVSTSMTTSSSVTPTETTAPSASGETSSSAASTTAGMTTSSAATSTERSTSSSSAARTTTIAAATATEHVYSKCDVLLTDEAGNISSPGFPANYKNNQRCVTTIQAESVSTVTIEFVEFDVEFSEKCGYDSLTIIPDSMSPNKTSIDDVVLCGDELPMTLFTFQTSAVQLVFTSDKSIDKAGYFAKYYVTPPSAETCPLQCDNGGVCTRTNKTSWICECAAGFGGDLCEDEYIDTCFTHECQNGGGCVMRQGRPECHCPDGFTGAACEKRINIVVNDTTNSIRSAIFSKFPSNMTLAMGSSVLMECAVRDPTADVMWLHRERILSEGDHSSGIEVHPGGVIHIPDVTDDQEGKYTCVGIFSNELHEVSAWIKLIQPCHLTVVIPPRNVSVEEGYSALFQCFVPDAEFTVWRKDGELLRLDKRKRVLVNNYLRIEKIIETDSGEYTCAARGRNGCSARISAFMQVKTKGHKGDCGRPRLVEDTVNLRISSGRESPVGAVPWHVIIRERTLGITYCGGSLITDRWVMTAAHCITQFKQIFTKDFQKENIDLYFGTRHCRGDDGIRRGIKNYTIHLQFNGSYHNNDIALFQLDHPIIFSDLILPVCLEKLPFVEELLKSGRLGMVTGCGELYEDGRSPLHLNEVRIPYVNRNECRRRVEAIPDALFTENMICAGYQRSMRGDACAGDSGGAFVMEFHGRWIQVGIVSWGVGCDRRDQYGYYTHVGKFYDWILKIVSKI